MEKTLYHIFSGADGILQCKCWKCRCERNSNYEKKCVINWCRKKVFLRRSIETNHWQSVQKRIYICADSVRKWWFTFCARWYEHAGEWKKLCKWRCKKSNHSRKQFLLCRSKWRCIDRRWDGSHCGLCKRKRFGHYSGN